MSPRQILPWSQARAQVFPHVRDRFFLEVIRLKSQLDERDVRPLPHQQLTEHVCVVGAVLGPEGLQIVTAAHLEDWGVDFSELIAVAKENLQAASSGPLERRSKGLYISTWGDSLDADRFVIDEIFRGLDVAGETVVIVPNRLTLIVTGTDDTGALSSAFEIAEAASAMEHVISSTPFVRRWPAFDQLALGEDHPLFPAWRRLCLIDQMLAYEPQRTLLERLYEKRGQQTQVGRCRLREDHRTGELTTHCVWNNGVDLLLPRANDVALFDRHHTENDGVIAIVPWRAIEKHCRHHLQRTDDYPARFRVLGFPSSDEIGAMVEEFGAETFVKD